MADFDPFATQTPESARNAQKEYYWHQEQKRRANDTIRVANPVEITIKGQVFKYPHGDHYTEWEQGRHRVPVGSTLDTVRYIAQKYCREMFVEIVNAYGQQMGETLLKKVGKENPEVLLDKYFENKQVWDKVPKTDDEKLMAEIWPQLWIGVVKEFGLDEVAGDPRSGEVDFRSPEERILSDLGNKMIDDTSTVLEPVNDTVLPLAASKEELTKEITND